MTSVEGVLHKVCFFFFLFNQSVWLMQMHLCAIHTHKKIVCLWLLCVCAAADARPLGGIWLSGGAIKWPVLCISVCIHVCDKPCGWGPE